MAALTSPAPKAYHGQVTVTGAAAATQLIDLTSGLGSAETGWNVLIWNADPDTGDDLFVGFTSTVDATDGFPVSNLADDALNRKLFLPGLPPHTKIYANCTSAETRDVRYIAYPTYS